MSEDAEELVNQLSLTCKNHLNLPSSRPFAHSIRSSIAIAIQRGNAITVQAGFSRAIMKAERQAAAADTVNRSCILDIGALCKNIDSHETNDRDTRPQQSTDTL